MFLPRLDVSENDLMNANTILPYIKRGQWVKIRHVGTVGQFVGFNQYARTVCIAWYCEGRNLQQQNSYLKMCCEYFDRQQEDNYGTKIL